MILHFSEFFRFLFYKESAPYRQYQELIRQFKSEMGKTEDNYKPEDLYEPEMAIEDDAKEETQVGRHNPYNLNK